MDTWINTSTHFLSKERVNVQVAEWYTSLSVREKHDMCTLSGHIECFKLYQQFNQDSGRAPERPLVPSTVREELLHHTYHFVFAGNQMIVDLNYTTG